MSFISKLFYLSRQQKLPRLRHHLTSGRKLDTFDSDTQILLEAGLMRDWANARRMVKNRKQSALELFWELSKKRKADWRGRLNNWLIYLVGGYQHDPHAYEFKAPKPYAHLRDARRKKRR
jgi:hypothetical protein